MAAFSESPAIGMRALAWTGVEHLGGQPVALGADQQRQLRCDPRQRPAQLLGGVGAQRQQLAGEVAELGRRGRASTVKIAPMLARTAFGP